MPNKYVFDPIAADEYQTSFEWHEKTSSVAADNFILSVQNTIYAICSDPYRYRNNYKDLRELKIAKYPFQLIYFIDKQKKANHNYFCFSHKTSSKRKIHKK